MNSSGVLFCGNRLSTHTVNIANRIPIRRCRRLRLRRPRRRPRRHRRRLCVHNF